MSKLEGQIQKELLISANEHPKVKRLIRTNSGKIQKGSRWIHLCPEGWPDLTGYSINGQFIAIELKRPDTKKNTSDEQEEFIAEMHDVGCAVGVAWDKESLLAILDNII